MKNKWIPWALAAILLAYAFLSNMDYHEARMAECSSKNLVWDSNKDVCTKSGN